MRRPTTAWSRRVGAAAALPLLAAGLTMPTAAHAAVDGSIVFIRDGDIWIMPADDPGAARAVTTDGSAEQPYALPQMHSSGLIYAVASLGDGVDGSGDIVTFNRAGQLLNSFRPITTGLIYSLNVSPDGQTLAFGWGQSSSSPTGGGGSTIGTATFSGFANADGSSSNLPTSLEGKQPVFYDDDTAVLVSPSDHYSTTGFSYYELGEADERAWFLTCQSTTTECAFPRDPDVHTGAGLLAATTPPIDSFGGDRNTIAVWDLAGAPPAQPAKACEHVGSGMLWEPEWSPDGDALMWEDDNRTLYVAEGFAAGCQSAFSTARVLVSNATWASWSSASPDPAPGDPVPTDPNQPGPTAPAPRAIDDSCPEGEVPPNQFSDVPNGSAHERAISCLVWWEVANGRTATTYAPSDPVTRDAMAAFIARAVSKAAPGSLSDSPPDAFTDDSGSVHQKAINQLAEAGIVGGTGGGRYNPSGLVNRGQMARFLANAAAYLLDPLPADRDYFSDDAGNLFEADINRVAQAGITGGRSDGTYNPAGVVTRDQMGSFLARLLDLFVEAGAQTPA